MKFTLHFGNNTFPDLAGASRLAKAAEAAGFDSVIAVDHVVFPDHYTSTYPYSTTGRLFGGPDTPLPDPLIWMAYVASATHTIKLGTAILIVPQRNPLYTAKEVANVDWLSGGRFDFGIGVGWMAEEMALLGAPPPLPTPELQQRFERLAALTREFTAGFPAIERSLEAWDHAKPVSGAEAFTAPPGEDGKPNAFDEHQVSDRAELENRWGKLERAEGL